MAPLSKRLGRGIHVAVFLSILIFGCRVNGNWQTETVDPPGAPFPLQRLALDSNQNYAAMWTENGKEKGSSGQYLWNGYQLKVAQSGREPRTYGAWLGLNGKLKLTYQEEGRKVTATLSRQPKAAPPKELPSNPSGAPDATQPSHDNPPTSLPAAAPRRPSQPR